jgi:hypothetical protein
VRYVIELRRTKDDRVEGELMREGISDAAAFSGWAELLSLLEPPPDEPAESEPPAVGGGITS